MIRLYNEEDIEDIITLEKKILNTTLGDSLYIDLENPFARHYVYIDNNKLLGYISSVFDCINPAIFFNALNLILDLVLSSLFFAMIFPPFNY